MLLEQRTQQILHLFGQLERLQLGRVGQTIHHGGDTTLLQRFGDGFPTELDQLAGVTGVDATGNHLVIAEDGARLQHATQDGLLTHQVRLHFGNEGGLQNTGTVTTGGSSPRLGDGHAFTARIVFRVNGDQGRYTETTLVLFTNFGTRALGSNHDHGQILTDLGAFLNDVEAVGVTQGSAFLHQRHHSLDHAGVLLVRSQVNDQIGSRNQVFVSINDETIGSSLLPGLATLGNGFGTQGIGHIQAGVTHVQTLVQTLGTTTNDDDFLALEEIATGGEFITVHETTLAQLGQLLTQIQGIEVVRHGWLRKKTVNSLCLHKAATAAL